MKQVSDHDRATVSAQMGRPLRGRSQVASRCDLGLPVVLRVEPLFEDGTPFPTLYYLTCPLARARVSRLEAAGWIRALQAELERDPALAAAFAASQAEYARQRAALLPAGAPGAGRVRGGVGGSRGGIKCLHAQFAHARAGGTNPIGERVAAAVEPLGCERPCVVGGQRDPAWREPEGPEQPVV